ncbi:hypothetical protein ACVMHR_000952 [Bradyrhizobium diazoefficiens]
METTLPILSMSVAAAASAAAAFPKLKARIELSRAKHRSLAGHSKMSRRVARLLPFYEFGENDYFSCDGAPRRTSRPSARTASSASQASTPSAIRRGAR